MAKSKIKVAIVGCGNCANSLVAGLMYYTKYRKVNIGKMYPNGIGGYKEKDIEFVVGFDIDKRKVGKSLVEALYAKPNCVMEILPMKDIKNCGDAKVYRGPTLDGIASHMKNLPEDITFVEDTDTPPVSVEQYKQILRETGAEVLLNYLPVGSEEASKWYIENALEAGVNIVNCMPTYISTDDAKKLEEKAIRLGRTIIGSDMRSMWGASRLSEVLQGAMLDAGLVITQHIQENKACDYSQGHNPIDVKTGLVYGASSNTDFGNMAVKERLKNKHISKENVLKGQNIIRNTSIDGMTLYAGPSLVVSQKPHGQYQSSDTKVCNIDMIAFGWGGAKYSMTINLRVQDSPNSGAIVANAIRFLRVASEMGMVGYLRGPSGFTQKTPPLQMKSADSKYECDMLARRKWTKITKLQHKDVALQNFLEGKLEYTFQKDETDYE